MLVGAMATVAATTRVCHIDVSRTQLRRAQRKHTLSCRQATLTASETQVVQSVRIHKADCNVLQLPVRNPSEANSIAMLHGLKSSSQYNADRRLHRATGKYKHTHFPEGDDTPPPTPPPLPLPSHCSQSPPLSILSGLPGAVHNIGLEDFRATLYSNWHGSLNVCGRCVIGAVYGNLFMKVLSKACFIWGLQQKFQGMKVWCPRLLSYRCVLIKVHR